LPSQPSLLYDLQVLSNGQTVVPTGSMSIVTGSMTVLAGGLTVTTGGMTVIGNSFTQGSLSIISASTTRALSARSSAGNALTGRMNAGPNPVPVMQLTDTGVSLFAVSVPHIVQLSRRKSVCAVLENTLTSSRT
jgi:hypothetical protein